VQDKGLDTLEVFLVGGPVADDFVKKNPVVSRTIQIRADQTLAQLHAAIFEAANLTVGLKGEGACIFKN
jgi:hypothetical protein